MSQSTQDHLPIAGIQDGVLLMNDGSLRVVLQADPINFDLKSQQEQDGIIYAYQSFLNSLDFSIQIVVQSRQLDLEPYLLKMEAVKNRQPNDLLRIQTEDYIGFVRRIITLANIMSKRFLIVVNHSSIIGKNAFNPLAKSRPTGPLMDQDQFDRMRGEIYGKASIISGGLARLGVRAEPLGTQKLIELFYGIYNPDVASEERLVDTEALNAAVITSPDAHELAEQFGQQNNPNQES